jgi:hypothetical protein
MPGNPFYKSRAWARLRAAVLKRARGRCEIPGCTSRAFIVDHIVSRRNGGRDAMDNLRALCRTCDNRIKEDHAGQRRSGGSAIVGCFSDGSPRDPTHPWYTGGPAKQGSA